nr:uncharacterized protein LOC117280012 [Nicotiana tomentosiformis]
MGKPFNDVVKKGEMVEEGLKSSKIISYSSIKATTQAIQNGTGILLGKNKKDDVAMVVSGPWRGPRVHSRVFGPHMNRYVLGKKILRAGYFWFTMERDCIRFVRKYHHYQVHSDLIHSPSSELQTMYAPWHFVTWSMDVIGPIKSAASNRHRFILVAINYFTKWVEAVTFKSVTKKSSNERGMPIVQAYESNSTPYRPKANGAAEADNKNIKNILRKMVQGATPYLLVYGTGAVIPAEVDVPPFGSLQKLKLMMMSL